MASYKMPLKIGPMTCPTLTALVYSPKDLPRLRSPLRSATRACSAGVAALNATASLTHKSI